MKDVADQEFQQRLRSAYSEIKDKSKKHVDRSIGILIVVADALFLVLCPGRRRILSHSE